MFRKYKYTYLVILAIISMLSVVITVAFLAINDASDDSRDIGNVEVTSFMYHDTIATPAKEVEIIDITTTPNTTYTKPGIFNMNVSDPNDPYYIDKLRVDFNIESNVETYIRVKFVIAEILTYRNNNGELVEIATNIDDIIFNLNEDWYYDVVNQYYYIQNTVIKDGINPTTINFVVAGLNYPTKSPQYTVQIRMKYEAVQAHLGPQKNWGLTNPPWGGNW